MVLMIINNDSAGCNDSFIAVLFGCILPSHEVRITFWNIIRSIITIRPTQAIMRTILVYESSMIRMS